MASSAGGFDKGGWIGRDGGLRGGRGCLARGQRPGDQRKGKGAIDHAEIEPWAGELIIDRDQ